ncbi:MAG: TIGR02186 family protein [Hyphomicrobium sp.]
MSLSIVRLLREVAPSARSCTRQNLLPKHNGGSWRRCGMGKRAREGFAVLLVLATLFATVLAGARTGSAQIVADISDHLIAITTGFTGAELLLFGAAESGTVVVVVRGPRAPLVVRRKARVAGIWINRTEMIFRNVPHYYAVASSKPLATIPDTVRARHEMGTDALRLQAPKDIDPEHAASYRQALIRNMQNDNLYYREPAHVNFLGPQLFRADIRFPANAPVGLYEVFVYLVRDGEVISAQGSPLHVSRIGFEAWIFDFAQRRSLSYGIVAILLAVMAGWAASLIFRKE